MQTIEKRKKFIINVIYVVFIIGAFYLFMKFAFWLLFPFIFAFIVAMALQKPVQKISQRTKLKKGLVSGLSVVFLFSVLIFVVIFLGTRAFIEFKGFLEYLSHRLDNLPQAINEFELWLLDAIRVFPDSAEKVIADFISNFSSTLFSDDSSLNFDFSWLASPLGGVWNTAKQIPMFIVAFVVTIIATCFMTAGYQDIRRFVFNQLSPKNSAQLSQMKNMIIHSTGKLAKAYMMIIIITCFEISLGLGTLSLLGLYDGKYIFIIASVTAIVDIFPVIGTGAIILPWAIYSLLFGNVGFGVGLLIMYAIIAVIRQIIEPKLVAGQLGLPPILAIMAMYIGARIFGAIGLFLLPFTLIIIKRLNEEGIINIYKTSKDIKDKKIKHTPKEKKE